MRVWDSTAEQRYLVLPERPAGTGTLSEDELAALVTRDAMIGVAKVKRRRGMNGVYDMGGMQDMGPIQYGEEQNRSSMRAGKGAWPAMSPRGLGATGKLRGSRGVRRSRAFRRPSICA